MRAVLCRDFSGPDHLEVGEAPDPAPADDEILIDVHAASVTYMDHLLVSGGYQMRPPTPFVPGTEAAGVVAAVGRQVTRFKPGDRAACLSWIGGLGQRMVAKEWKSVRIPDAVSFETAATVIHSYDTAYYALVLRAQLQAGETVVVTGAGGGVGMAAVDVARHLGGRVIALVGSDRHAAALRERGVERDRELQQRKAARPAEGVDRRQGHRRLLRQCGRRHVRGACPLDGWGGRLLPIGFTSGEVPKLAMNLPLLKNFSIIGVFAGAWEDKEPEAARLAKETLMQWIADGKIRPHVGMVLPLERIGEAMAAIGDANFVRPRRHEGQVGIPG